MKEEEGLFVERKSQREGGGEQMRVLWDEYECHVIHIQMSEGNPSVCTLSKKGKRTAVATC